MQFIDYRVSRMLIGFFLHDGFMKSGIESLAQRFDLLNVEFFKNLPAFLKANNHKVFVLDETNPLSMYASEKRIILVITESRGEIAGLHTNKKQIVDSYLQLFREMLNRSKPIDYHIQRLVI